MEIDLSKLTPDIRHLDDMREVLYDQEWAKSAPDMDLYYMYRKVKQENGLNHSITITLAKLLGEEFNKTKGHTHVGDFKETYTVFKGQAIFLIQKTKGEIVEDVYAIKAGEGESIIIPPGCGHVTINPSDAVDLTTGDWASENSKNDYHLFEKLKGACYFYILQPGSGQASWIKNENYKSVPELRFKEPLKSVPQDLSFLK
jgi:glucose-6-phosphate isomerase